jgi:hypothetical protein
VRDDPAFRSHQRGGGFIAARFYAQYHRHGLPSSRTRR